MASKTKVEEQTTSTDIVRASDSEVGGDVPLDFEEALAELERLVTKMETGGLSLDDSILAYRRGVKLARACQDKLNAAQLQVSVLEKDLLRPFEAMSESLGDEDE